MKIKIISVGKLKERYWREAAAEYLKRLTPYSRVTVLEVDEEKIPDNASLAEIEQVKKKEGLRIASLISSADCVIPLAIEGKALSSEEMAELFDKLSLQGKSQLAFIIGGSHGLSREILKKGELALSFSCMTFPHQLMRVILLEQIYRCFKIKRGEPYHK